MRKIVIVLVIAAGVAATARFAMRKADPYHTAERRGWKDRAVIAIVDDLKAPGFEKARRESQEWLTKSIIVCEDGSWLAYRSQCHKEDPAIHDIFVAKASDGRWYYSDFHFCIGAMVLEMHGPPESLAAFKARYHLAEFDGISDVALAPTWKR